jgi:hypothetical protein
MKPTSDFPSAIVSTAFPAAEVAVSFAYGIRFPAMPAIQLFTVSRRLLAILVWNLKRSKLDSSRFPTCPG